MNKKTSAPFAANTQIACVSIDFNSYLLPIAKALKVIELMSGAVPCERTFSGKDGYLMRDRACQVEMSVVPRNQIVPPRKEPGLTTITPLVGYDDGI